MSCLFCDIASGKTDTKKVYEDDKVIAFEDIDKKAPIHILVIPKSHIESVNGLNADNISTVSHIFLVIKKLMEDFGVKNGYRIVNNCGQDGGQTVNHLHFHVMAGRQFTWPAG